MRLDWKYFMDTLNILNNKRLSISMKFEKSLMPIFFFNITCVTFVKSDGNHGSPYKAVQV